MSTDLFRLGTLPRDDPSGEGVCVSALSHFFSKVSCLRPPTRNDRIQLFSCLLTSLYFRTGVLEAMLTAPSLATLALVVVMMMMMVVVVIVAKVASWF